MKRYQTIAELPPVLPVFPLPGALLLPRTELPLNIFEPRYLALFEDSMASHRVIGMIQPAIPAKGTAEMDKPELTRVGCAGRITSYAETDDGRLLVALTGICRFEVEHELAVATPYRQLAVTYDGFAADLAVDNESRSVNRDAVLKAFRQYLEANNMSANWDEVAQIGTENLVNALSQLAPYPAPDKQALLEAPNVKARADMLIALTELALARTGNGAGTLQ